MFSIGEKISYPAFGAGFIINIEEKKILNETKKYYIIKFINGMDMMIPVFSDESSKIRKAVSEKECIEIFKILESKPENLPEKWAHRYKYYRLSINEGDIKNLSKILRDISCYSKNRNISKSETKIFYEILDLVAGEISIVLKKDLNQIKKEIIDILDFNIQLI